MKIALTGGGTAGHISGNMALVPELKKAGFDIEYIGAKRGMEKGIVAADPDILYHGINAGKLIRQFTFENLKNAVNVIKGLRDANRVIKESKPDIVFSKGGFVTVPVVIAAHKNNIPVIIHESDYTPGLANKISAKYATTICTTFEETAAMFKSDKAVWTGSPLRDELFTGSKAMGYSLTGFDGNRPVILIMGGSTGSLALNEFVWASVNELNKKYDIVHICGKGGTNNELGEIRGYKQFEYVSAELKHLFAIADAAISRAGSNAIFEFLRAEIPMLLIPLPKGISRGDQVLNAESFERNGYAIMRDQEKLDREGFIGSVNELFLNKEKITEKIKKSAISNGKDKILELIFKECAKTCKKS